MDAMHVPGRVITDDGEVSLTGEVTAQKVEQNPELVLDGEKCGGGTTENKKVSHKQWRRYQKKMRRKSARQALAQLKERLEREEKQRKSLESGHDVKLKEQLEKEEEFRKEIEHQQWLEREKNALLDIKQAQKVREEVISNYKPVEAVSENGHEEAMDREDPKKELLKAELKRLEEQQNSLPHVQKVYHNPERPCAFPKVGNSVEIDNIHEHEKKDFHSLLRDPNNCSFFMKTGACRYGARCSRSHVRCENSSTIMIQNFFQNARLEIPMINESGNDADIEYDESELIQEFENFYDDIIEEFKSAGTVVMFKCCQNYVPHLRGNVYVQYSNPEDAMKALRMFNGRYYAGRQLSVELSPVSNWKSSICGMFLKRCCPRGKACNFLHVFRNPRNAYSNFDTEEIIRRIKEENNCKKWNSHQRTVDKDMRRRNKHGMSQRSRLHSRSHSGSPSPSRSHDLSYSRRGYSRSRSRSRSRSQSRSPRRKRYKTSKDCRRSGNSRKSNCSNRSLR